MMHLHESYPAHCGDKTGVQTTDIRHVSCPTCSKNEEDNTTMEIDAFLKHLDVFHAEFDINIDPQSRSDKLVEEMVEFLEASTTSTKEHADDEAIDVLVCAIANVKARGINNMLFVAYQKLERTADKYRLQNNGGGKCLTPQK